MLIILDVNLIYSSRTFKRGIKKRLLQVKGARMKKRQSLLWGDKLPKGKLTHTRLMSNGSSARPSDDFKIN